MEQFRVAYGDEYTVGLEDLVKTDYMSSEHSDAGAIDEIEYTQHQHQHGGDNAFEIRREVWRSEQVCPCQVLLLYDRADLSLNNSSIACMLVYRPFRTKIGRQPRRTVLEDVRE